MIDYSKIAAKIDDVANRLQEMGCTKEAEHLDMIANSVEALELEAGWLSKFLGGLGISLSMLGSLTPAQAEVAEDRWQKLSPQQTETLKKKNPKSYAALQEGIQRAKFTPAKAMGGPQMTGKEKSVKKIERYTNPQGGPGEADIVYNQDGTVDVSGDPVRAHGGTIQDVVKSRGQYIP